MRDNGRASIRLRKLNAVERLGQRADLIDLDQNLVGDADINSFLKELGIRYKKIVANELNFLPD
jgi:hypothetical protein